MKITVIPAIDVIGGKCVRLTRGNYDECKTYYNDPVEAARHFEDMGMRRLHLVDLDGARESRVINWRVLERICEATRLEVDFSGGIKSDEDICRVFDAGVWPSKIEKRHGSGWKDMGLNGSLSGQM